MVNPALVRHREYRGLGNGLKHEIDELIYEVRVFYQSLLQIGEEIHQLEGISMGMRAVLEYLKRNGNSTVPQMARERRVSRQRIQSLVDELKKSNLVEARVNPASKRSPLISLTAEGKQLINSMKRKEAGFLTVDVSAAKIRGTTQTLAEVRAQLEARLNLE